MNQDLRSAKQTIRKYLASTDFFPDGNLARLLDDAVRYDELAVEADRAWGAEAEKP